MLRDAICHDDNADGDGRRHIRFPMHQHGQLATNNTRTLLRICSRSLPICEIEFPLLNSQLTTTSDFDELQRATMSGRVWYMEGDEKFRALLPMTAARPIVNQATGERKSNEQKCFAAGGVVEGGRNVSWAEVNVRRLWVCASKWMLVCVAHLAACHIYFQDTLYVCLCV